MATMSTALKANDINHAVMQTFDPNNWAAFETAALHRLQAQLPAAHVATVVVDVLASGHHTPIGLKFTVTSTAVLTAPQVKGALR